MSLGEIAQRMGLPYKSKREDEYGNTFYEFEKDWEIAITQHGNLLVMHEGVCKLQNCDESTAIKYVRDKINP